MVRSIKEAKKMEMSFEERQVLDDEHLRLAVENADLLDFVYMAASPKRRDGTFNNSREALQQKAEKVLSKIGL